MTILSYQCEVLKREHKRALPPRIFIKSTIEVTPSRFRFDEVSEQLVNVEVFTHRVVEGAEQNWSWFADDGDSANSFTLS